MTSACDTTDRAALTAALDGIPLTAVLAADDSVDGARHLTELAADVDAFILCSTAFANSAFDELARSRHADGLPATSLGWGPWTASARTGLGAAAVPLTTDEGLALFDLALGLDRPAMVPIKLNLSELRADNTPHLLRDLVSVPIRRLSPRPVVAGPLWTDNPIASAGREALLHLVRAEAAVVLGHPEAGAVGTDEAFGDLGFDSLTALELRNRLSSTTGLHLPASLLFRYPTPALLADYLGAELAS